ncbi:MAG: tetratricopeptide repeat protein, partial [Bacteriovoracaceae bacterium]
KYSISLIRGGDLELAQKVLEDLWTKEREERVGLILAGVYTGMDQEDKSIEVYKQVLALNKNSEDACVFLSKGYVVKKQTDKALAQLQTCSRNNPKNGMYDFYLGKLYQDLGKKKEAMASYQSSLKKQPSLGASVAALGSMYEEKENFNKSISIYKNHLKKFPKDREILSRIVNALFLMERYEEVIGYAEVLSDLDSDNLNLKVKLGVLYTDTKQYPKAIGMFKDLLRAAPESDKVLYYLGAIYQELQNYEHSIDYFNRITPQSGLYTDSSLQVANMLSHLAQTQGVKSKWHSAFIEHVDKRIEELKDFRVELSVVKASYFENLGQFNEASEALTIAKDDKKFSDQHVYYLANLLNRVEKYEESIQLVEKILEKDPNNAHAWNFLGYSLLERGVELEKSYEYIQKAVSLAPNDGYIRDSLGWYYYKIGDLDKALKELNYAFKQVPGDVEILKHLAIVHKELKDFRKARSFIDRALSQTKYDDERQKILTVMEGIEMDRVPASGKDNN